MTTFKSTHNHLTSPYFSWIPFPLISVINFHWCSKSLFRDQLPEVIPDPSFPLWWSELLFLLDSLWNTRCKKHSLSLPSFSRNLWILQGRGTLILLCVPDLRNSDCQAQFPTLMTLCLCTCDPRLCSHFLLVEMTAVLNQNFLITPHYPSEMLLPPGTHWFTTLNYYNYHKW